jgi:hypothetical protein
MPGALIGLAAAVGMGVLVGTQPVTVSIAVILTAVFGIAAAISPITALVVLLILSPLRTLIETESPLRLPLDIGQLTLLMMLLAWAFYRVARG